jgi:hypothetical protein
LTSGESEYFFITDFGLDLLRIVLFTINAKNTTIVAIGFESKRFYFIPFEVVAVLDFFLLSIKVVSGLAVEHVFGELEFTGLLWDFLHVHGFVFDLEQGADFVAGGYPGDEGDDLVQVGFFFLSKVMVINLLIERGKVG